MMELKVKFTTSQRPALRLVSTKGLSREEWHLEQFRSNRLGPESVPVVARALGGQDQSQPKPNLNDQSSSMCW
jgi:hypothetical protein